MLTFVESVVQWVCIFQWPMLDIHTKIKISQGQNMPFSVRAYNVTDNNDIHWLDFIL